MLPSTPYLLLRPANVVAAAAGPAAAFLARTSGLSGTETTAYTNLINGLVSDGVFSLLDCLYIFATNTTTTANLNLVSTSFGLTGATPPTFTADQGYTGNGSTQFLNTNFNASTAGGHATLNSTAFGVYTLTNRANNSSIAIGAADATAFSYMTVYGATNQMAPEVNGFTFTAGAGVAASQGFSTASRTVSGSIDMYKNGSSTSLFTVTDPSTNLPNASYDICAYNNAGTATNLTTDQIAAAYIGAGVSGAQHVLLSNRINAYMTALGINVY